MKFIHIDFMGTIWYYYRIQVAEPDDGRVALPPQEISITRECAMRLSDVALRGAGSTGHWARFALLLAFAVTFVIGNGLGCVPIGNGSDGVNDNSMADDDQSGQNGNDNGSDADGNSNAGNDNGSDSGDTSMPNDNDNDDDGPGPSTGQNCLDDSTCDDGDPCTVDECQDGQCRSFARCDPEDEECVEGECVPAG